MSAYYTWRIIFFLLFSLKNPGAYYIRVRTISGRIRYWQPAKCYNYVTNVFYYVCRRNSKLRQLCAISGRSCSLWFRQQIEKMYIATCYFLLWEMNVCTGVSQMATWVPKSTVCFWFSVKVRVSFVALSEIWVYPLPYNVIKLLSATVIELILNSINRICLNIYFPLSQVLIENSDF